MYRGNFADMIHRQHRHADTSVELCARQLLQIRYGKIHGEKTLLRYVGERGNFPQCHSVANSARHFVTDQSHAVAQVQPYTAAADKTQTKIQTIRPTRGEQGKRF